MSNFSSLFMKPSIPKGTRDFSPEEVAKRNYIFNIIKDTFTLFGFQPIETPSFENSETLMGKYGEEGDRLIFKILNSGDFLSKVPQETYADKDSLKLTSQISEKALRYDLTVPFARYVVQHQHEITFPFKRYQIQPVWRADRPQKGRFREFFQCDADVVGSDSLWQEVELIQLYDTVFTKLRLKETTIKINNRKLLSGIAQVIGAEDKLVDFTVALDKLDKIGEEGVVNELVSKGFSQDKIDWISEFINTKVNYKDPFLRIEEFLKDSNIGKQGIQELRFILNNVEKLGLSTAMLEFDFTLARGLNYYTGAIIEVSAPDKVDMGSIGGGGRYDDLTGIFGLKNISGVGISFGLDRIYLVLEAMDLFPKTIAETTKAVFLNFGDNEAFYALQAISNLRENGISVELYPDAAKLAKQMSYADKRNLPFVIIAGEKEIMDNSFTLKDMKSGEQQSMDLEGLIKKLKNFLQP